MYEHATASSKCEYARVVQTANKVWCMALACQTERVSQRHSRTSRDISFVICGNRLTNALGQCKGLQTDSAERGGIHHPCDEVRDGQPFATRNVKVTRSLFNTRSYKNPRRRTLNSVGSWSIPAFDRTSGYCLYFPRWLAVRSRPSSS